DIACVVAHGPRVLLLDEPSSGIAQREAEALAPQLLRVRDELGASVVVIEHDLVLLRAVADRLLALDLGRVIAVGDPATVVADPAVLPAGLGREAVSGGVTGVAPGKEWPTREASRRSGRADGRHPGGGRPRRSGRRHGSVGRTRSQRVRPTEPWRRPLRRG